MSKGIMRLLFVVDGRSPIALNWISYFVNIGHEVHMVSTFNCEPALNLASLNVVPVAFSGTKPLDSKSTPKRNESRSGFTPAFSVKLRTSLRQWLGPFTLSQAGVKLREIILRIQPDLVHAMRIPFEGMVASLAKTDAPLLISVWGNDFTLHAESTPLMDSNTRKTLEKADALHADCKRDIRMAVGRGFNRTKPRLVLPGGGGVQLKVFYPPNFDSVLESSQLSNEQTSVQENGQERSRFTVINPRGLRAYVCNDVFFRAIPLVLAEQPEVQFVCTTMADERSALRWVDELGISENVSLLPSQTRSKMADLFRQSRVVISPSTHDGTPNTLLEAMACGCLPVVGDIESLREWITPGFNGLLIDPNDPRDMAKSILTALNQDDLYARALSYNVNLIAERAEYGKVMDVALKFYRGLIAE
ncbi:glycosyltransferase family 4 protein [Chloroflexota bacterium]